MFAEKKYHTQLVAAKSAKPLSEAVNELYGLVKCLDSAGEEIAAYNAPSECMDIVVKATARNAQAVAKQYGFLNLDILLDVIRERTTSKCVYKLGLGQLRSIQ
jgi:hypothetical protein